ncbi:prepilin-type N-terminal cleavage/methylation domain-containing protein [Candidatus Dojkabacteria bacterium]|nr:prepilin-type N-terminal cleavage/methylation domain-containing protein [Candidatus Dojkabacteria bacterium]
MTIRKVLNFVIKSQEAFSLIELLLYIAIVSVVLGVISTFLITLLQARVKNQTISEVEQQGVQVMQVITQTIRNSEDINSPSAGSSAAALSLDVVEAAKDPTTFDLSNDTVRVTEGAGSAIDLTNSKVVVTDLTFENLTRSGTPGVVRVTFTITHINESGRNEFDYSKTFYGSASLH